MLSLRERMTGPRFLVGVELVTTRGTMAETSAVKTRDLAGALGANDKIDWVSITDNAGGNPNLGAVALGKPILYAGHEVLIHLSCKDFNRSGLESQAWQLASEGFHNILALSGDYPTSGYAGGAKPVFDIDSVGLLALLADMNRGLAHGRNNARRLGSTDFFLGAVTTNFKLHENEVVPQYLKLDKKIQAGAAFVVTQIGYDARKSAELLAWMRAHGHGAVPVVGNVYLLTAPVARFFHAGRIPGVVVSDELLAECERRAQSPDKGRAWLAELAAKQVAIFRGLGYRGAYLGGIEEAEDVARILEIEASFAPDDWRRFAREIRYSRPGEFFFYAEDPEGGLCDGDRLDPAYEASLAARGKNGGGAPLGYRLSRFVHDRVFSPGTATFQIGRKVYAGAANQEQGPPVLRRIEHATKGWMFDCRDCGDCSLPDTAFLCPESQCAKNQRNGPCGGTRDGRCEVDERECIWSRAYDRLRSERREDALLAHAPVLQKQALRGTSSWANTFLGRDHHKTKGPTKGTTS